DLLLVIRGGGLTVDASHEVRPFRSIRCGERGFAPNGSGGCDVGGHALQFLPHVERVDAGRPSAAPDADSEALSLADVAPRDVEEDRKIVLAAHDRPPGAPHTPIAGDTQRATPPQRLGPVREPQA